MAVFIDACPQYNNNAQRVKILARARIMCTNVIKINVLFHETGRDTSCAFTKKKFGSRCEQRQQLFS